MSKRIAIVGTNKYRINANDFWMFFNRSNHKVENVFLYDSIRKSSWFMKNSRGMDSKARDNHYDPFDKNRCKFFYSDRELLNNLQKSNPDYICLGNGNCGTCKEVIRIFGRERILFSEYGWLPWSEHFYISKNGAGFESDITKIDDQKLSSVTIRSKEIELIKNKLDSGPSVPYKNFIYVPLQVDQGDFKFNFTHFKNNSQFVQFISEIVPKEYTILVKNHPLNKNPLNMGAFKRVVDISRLNYNKYQLLSNMKAMMCINSTSVLEGIMFEKPVFTYGQDLFSNKSVVFEKVSDAKDFQQKLSTVKPINNLCRAFTSLLIERQVNRLKCLNNDQQYIKGHFWNTSL